ncbi:sulfatase-like hydrolase/transferase [Roseicyclus marinus]|uniref:sulfatase-like hydrolase/transferase n=1 Tax=Roseicyclus marinus TaxID=2161673 RepID=UPI002410007D|nr:sulfatase-like hydrolase/transferase [Roseicyclus marinus]MDG3040508.1 sulfatase-like hydrolase/transferase [Roseicyclus marinus]
MAAAVPTLTRFRLRPALRLILAALVLHLVLIQPNHPAAMTWGALRLFPLELPAILLGLIAVGQGRAGLILRRLLVAALAVIAALKTADFAMFTALARGFNPVSDLALIEAGLRLLTGSIGLALTVLAASAALIALAAVIALLWWATGVWAGAVAPRPLARSAVGAAAIVSGAIVIGEIGDTMGRWSLPYDPPGAAFTARVGVERWQSGRATLADLRAFEAAAARDPWAEAGPRLDLIDRDVIVVFVESYGRTSHDTALFADLHRATLEAGEADLAGRGLSMASGYLASPTRGGQSWLAHATLANGLWIDGQTRYGAALASGRRTLFHLAQEAGFHTAAVMPQITLDWPESLVMGFDTVLAAADLGYAGQNFNWVTMPDQFTYAAMDRLLREARPDDRPLFIQLATGTSHAPWVPVPEMVAWDDLGDGRIFDAMAAAGDPPDVVWRDRDRVRAQYRLAVDYALQAVLAYAARHAEDPPLMIVLGDHQAAGFVALDERPDVPIHVIGPAHLVERAMGWGLSPGLIPPQDAPVTPMDRMRDLILSSFTSAPPPGADS